MVNLSKKAVLITGPSRGVGEAVVLTLVNFSTQHLLVNDGATN